jgi:two-component system response regulator HydG
MRKILFCDDEASVRDSLRIIFKKDYQVILAGSADEAIQKVSTEEPDLVFLDIIMPGKDGLEALKEIRGKQPDLPVIMLTATKTLKSAVDAMKMGAYDYITKPFKMDELVLTVRKALENRFLKKEVVRLRKEVESRYDFHQLVGKSPLMQKIYDLIEKISHSASNVLISGESGTGKELVAKAVHYQGLRKEGPFIAVNCAAIPETLLESELFGYKKGAFTDARSDKRGLLFEANEGTLFLDEITEMPPTLQAKLLRVIEERTVRPLGDTSSYPIDVRIISTTNREMSKLIREGRFREDLYYRLKVIDIELPPLRNRKEDIPLIIQHFITKFNQNLKKNISGISEDALKLLLNYGWPGNVRELENVIERAITLTQGEVISPEDLPTPMAHEEDKDSTGKALREQYTVDQLEKEYIKKVLIEAGGNKSKAAQILGLDRKTLYRKLQEE